MAFSLWERDVLITRDYASTYENRGRSPERRLLMAVLKKAVMEFQDAAARPRHPQAEARLHELRTWFFSHDATWPFSFESVCEQLDLDPGWIRARLAPMVKQRPARSRRGGTRTKGAGDTPRR